MPGRNADETTKPTVSSRPTRTQRKAWRKPTVTRLPMDKTAANLQIASDGSGTSTAS